MSTARNGGISLEYETFGRNEAKPLLLISGTGVQMLIWPEVFCEALVARGFQVARFDNRDSGLSTHLTACAAPSMFSAMLRPSRAPYRLSDMADDAAAVMDEIGWTSAHIVGASLGGMIAQELAIRQPARVASLTSIMSTSSARIATTPTRAAMKAIHALDRVPVTNAEEAGDRALALKRVIGAGGYRLDEDAIWQIGRRSYLRRPDSEDGDRRQRVAVIASGDRRRRLADVGVPSLVIHGGKDPVIGVKGGRSTAAAIPGSRLRIFPEMAHDLPSAVWPDLIDEIDALSALATRIPC